VDIELNLLRHMTKVENIRKIWDQGVKSKVFVDPLNRAAFDFAESYWLNARMQSAPTAEVLKHEFPSFEYEEPEETVEWLIGAIQERFVTNVVQDSVREVATQAGGGDPIGAIKTMYTSSWKTLQDITPRTSRSNLAENIDQRLERYTRRAAFTGEVRGLPIGLEQVDQHTNGVLPGELAAFVGFAKTGKSHILCSAAKAHRLAGFTPYVATLELSVEDFEDRLDAHMSGLSYTKIQRGRLEREEIESLRRSQEEFASLGPMYIEKPPRGERSVPQLVNRARQLGCDSLLIDQLSFMESRKGYAKTSDKITEIMFDLKSEISEDETAMMPTFLAVQFNRESMKLKKGRGGMEHIGLSASIEQTVDIAYGLHQSREMRVNRSLVLDIMGFRRGAPQTWLLEWDLAERTRLGVRGIIEDE
jgi:replicative DNA helicase